MMPDAQYVEGVRLLLPMFTFKENDNVNTVALSGKMKSVSKTKYGFPRNRNNVPLDKKHPWIAPRMYSVIFL